jgi:hypothetical protein
MSTLIKISVWMLAIGLAIYCAAILYAWKFGMTGSKNVFLGSYALGCLLAAAGVAAGTYVLIKSKWPHLDGMSVVAAILVFVCVAVAMFYGMLNY